MAVYFLGVALGVVSHVGVAATYWQLSAPGVTVVVEGDEGAAQVAAATTLRLQSAARTLLSWPDTYREPPVLAFVVNERLLQRFFHFNPVPASAETDATTGHESWARTPSLIVVAVPKLYERGREFRALQDAYAHVLLDGAPTHEWPTCLQDGMSVVFAGAELTAPNHLFFPGNKFRGFLRVDSTDPFHVERPDEFLVPRIAASAPKPQWAADRKGYSCYLMSFMIASVPAEQRPAVARMLTEVGKGTALGSATTSELHQTLPEFTKSFYDFVHALQVFPDGHDLGIDFPEVIPAMPKPEPIASDRVEALMGQLCVKMQNCRK